MSGAYGSLVGNSDEAKKLLDNVRTYTAGAQAIFLAKLKEHENILDEYNLTWKLMGAACGAAIMVVSFMSLFTISPSHAILSIYCFFFGLTFCILEFPTSMFESYAKLITQEAHFLVKLQGRALSYVFVGVLVISIGSLLGLIVGICTAVVGLVIYSSSFGAHKSLDELRASLRDDRIVAAKFKEFDTDENGYLESAEVALLCQALGAPLNLNELESALAILDLDSDGQITYNEFIDWWKGIDEQLDV